MGQRSGRASSTDADICHTADRIEFPRIISASMGPPCGMAAIKLADGEYRASVTGLFNNDRRANGFIWRFFR